MSLQSKTNQPTPSADPNSPATIPVTDPRNPFGTGSGVINSTFTTSDGQALQTEFVPAGRDPKFPIDPWRQEAVIAYNRNLRNPDEVFNGIDFSESTVPYGTPIIRDPNKIPQISPNPAPTTPANNPAPQPSAAPETVTYPSAEDLFSGKVAYKLGDKYTTPDGKVHTIVGDGKGNLNPEITKYNLGKMLGKNEEENPAPTPAPAPKPAPNTREEIFQKGEASWYGPGFHGRRTASGEVFNQNALTAAHPSLPFGTMVEVTNKETGKSVIVRINDRGPHIGGRIIDLSAKAAKEIGMTGVDEVTLKIVK